MAERKKPSIIPDWLKGKDNAIDAEFRPLDGTESFRERSTEAPSAFEIPKIKLPQTREGQMRLAGQVMLFVGVLVVVFSSPTLVALGGVGLACVGTAIMTYMWIGKRR